MKLFIKFNTLLALAVLLCFSACNSNKNDANETDSTARDLNVIDTVKTSSLFDPDTTDIIPAGGYEENGSDTAVAAKIRRFLPVILEKQLVGMEAADRKFTYYQTDLNDDGNDEYFVGFTGMNWCGSGGCTALLLSEKGALITYFTVIDFPITILNEKNNGWKNLVAYSGGSDRILKWNKKKYPSNPSVEPKYTGTIEADFSKALQINEKHYPWFYF